MVFLKWNRPNIWGIAVTSKMAVEEPEVDEKTGQLKNPKAVSGAVVRNYLGNIINIRPGLNRGIPESVWDELKSHPDVKRELEEGGLEVMTLPESSTKKTVKVSDPLESKMSEFPGTLKDMKASDAIALIVECSQEDVLDAWLKEETRTGVVTAIKKQLDNLGKITNPKK